MATRSSKTSKFSRAAALAHHGVDPRSVPVTKPLEGQVKGDDVGYVYEVTDDVRLRRLTVMGTTQSTYYASADKLTDEAVAFLVRLVDEGKGMKVLDCLKDVHQSGSAPKMNMTFSILGFLTRCKDDAVRRAALDYTVYGLRTNSQLYSWLACHMESGHGKGFGRGPKTVITLRFHNNKVVEDVPHQVMITNPREYYPGMSAMNMAYQFTKYAQRAGISISDVLSLVHMKPTKARRPKTVRRVDGAGKTVFEPVAGTGGVTAGYVEWPLAKRVVLAYAKSGLEAAVHKALKTLDADAAVVPKATLLAHTPESFAEFVGALDGSTKEVLQYLWAVDTVKTEDVDKELALSLISAHNLPREVLATSLLRERDVWVALLVKDREAADPVVNMPITALIRNLGVMSARGLFDTSVGSASYRAYTRKLLDAVVAHLTNKDVLVRGRVHPASVVSALKTYKAGHGTRGSLTWTVCDPIVRALDAAVDLAYHTVKPTGKDTLHFIDISGSMTWASSTTGIEGMLAYEAACIEMQVHLRAARRGEDDSRQIVGTFSTDSRIVYDSDPSASALGLNKNMQAHLDAAIKRVSPGTRARNASDSSGYSSSAPTKNTFDPLTTSYLDVWNAVIRGAHMSATDCTQPVLTAMAMHLAGVASPEVIMVYTDNAASQGVVHTSVALKEYRKLVPGAKLVVVAATPTQFSIADPTDAGSLDVSGWDVGAATVIHDFVTGAPAVVAAGGAGAAAGAGGAGAGSY